MSINPKHLIGIVLLVALMPISGWSQTSDDAKADKVERAHRMHVVQKAWKGTKRDVSNGAHATTHATNKTWRGAKHVVAKGARATSHAAGTVWAGTKRDVGTVVRAPGKAIHKAKRAHEDREREEGETK